MKAFVFDAARCSGCHGCQIACKDEHCGNDWGSYAASQPETGHFWCGIEQTTHGQVPRVRMEYRVKMCRHCEKCALVEASGGVAYRREDGLVIIDPEKAVGRRDLVDACPYGNVYWNAELALPQKCTGCAHLVAAGENPRCVDACQTGGLRFGDIEDFGDTLDGAEMLDEGTGTNPRMYFLNLPKLFVAGNVWDKEQDEIIEGAKVTLLDADGAEVASQETDYFGDFEFKRLDAGVYSIRIDAEGFGSATREDIDVSKSLWLGDFPLVR